MKNKEQNFGKGARLLFLLVVIWLQIIIVWTAPSRGGKLAEVLKEIGRLSKEYNLPVANAFHAGDGNLHPLIMYDANEKNSLEKTEKFGADILKYCVKVGGVLTGEHGVGD